MGDQKRRMDILVEKIEALGTAYEAIRVIQKTQVVVMNILLKKMEVTNDEIKQETNRPNASSLTKGEPYDTAAST